jgi:two-component system, chemotaxis family, chemotaxis protein CheY
MLMSGATDVSVLIYSTNLNISRTMRTALRGMGVRRVHLAADENGIMEGFATADPVVAIIYVEGAEKDDGLERLRWLRRAPNSPKREIPVVVASQSRDIATIQAVINAGGHEYALFPASGDQLLKKITAARNSSRPFIETADYVGPCRRRRADPLYKGPERRAAAAAAASAEPKAS